MMMINRPGMSRADALRDLIDEYEDQRQVEATRLDNYRLRRARLELARETLVEHGESGEATRLRDEIAALDRHIDAAEIELTRLDGLLALYRRSLARLQGAS